MKLDLRNCFRNSMCSLVIAHRMPFLKRSDNIMVERCDNFIDGEGAKREGQIIVGDAGGS